MKPTNAWRSAENFDIVEPEQASSFDMLVEPTEITLYDVRKASVTIGKNSEWLFPAQHHAKFAIGVDLIGQR